VACFVLWVAIHGKNSESPGSPKVTARMKKLLELKKKREEDEARRLRHGVAPLPSETALSDLPETKGQTSLLAIFNLRDPNVIAGSGDQFLANRKAEYQKLLARKRMQLQEATTGISLQFCIACF
jgi:hypothetical protein